MTLFWPCCGLITDAGHKSAALVVSRTSRSSQTAPQKEWSSMKSDMLLAFITSKREEIGTCTLKSSKTISSRQTGDNSVSCFAHYTLSSLYELPIACILPTSVLPESSREIYFLFFSFHSIYTRLKKCQYSSNLHIRTFHFQEPTGWKCFIHYNKSQDHCS